MLGKTAERLMSAERYRSWMDSFWLRKALGGVTVSAALFVPMACGTSHDGVTTCAGGFVVSETVTDDGQYDVLLYDGCTHMGKDSAGVVSRLAVYRHGARVTPLQPEVVGRDVAPRETGTENLPLADHPDGYKSCEVIVLLQDGLIRPNHTSVSCTPATS